MQTKSMIAALALGSTLLAWDPASAQKSVAYQINPEHTGATNFPNGFNVPLQRVWSRSFWALEQYPVEISYPLIADGKVFVVVAAANHPGAMRLMALSLATGKTLWVKSLGNADPLGQAALAFDNGRLFVASGRGAQAFDPNTGAAIWTKLITYQFKFDIPPTARRGLLYLSDNGKILALNQATGNILWQQPVLGGFASSPTVTIDSVYVAYVTQVYKFSRTGALLWHFNGGLQGGGGFTAPFFSGRLYAGQSATVGGAFWVHNATDGQRVGQLENVLKPPAFQGKNGYFPQSDRLTAWDVTTNQTAWEFTGAQAPALPPIVINGRVIVVSHGGDLFVLRGASGTKLQQIALGAEIPFNGENNAGNSTLRKGMAAGEGVLVVPAGDTLIAFKGAP